MSSSTSLRLELRPSRWLRLALIVLAGLALFAVLRSRVSMWNLAWPVLLWALSDWQLRAQPRGHLVLHGDGVALWTPASEQSGGPSVVVEPVIVDQLVLQHRGPLAVLRFRIADHGRVWCAAPDTLPGAVCRRLRLWLQAHAASAVFELSR